MKKLITAQSVALEYALRSAIENAANKVGGNLEDAALSQCSDIFRGSLMDAFENTWEKGSSVDEAVQAMEERVVKLLQNEKMIDRAIQRHNSPQWTSELPGEPERAEGKINILSTGISNPYWVQVTKDQIFSFLENLIPELKESVQEKFRIATYKGDLENNFAKLNEDMQEGVPE